MSGLRDVQWGDGPVREPAARPDTLMVYRVQNEHGLGMYSGQGYKVFGDTSATERHPMPGHDEGLRALGYNIFRDWTDDWKGYPKAWNGIRFGFASVAQFRNWVYKAEWCGHLARLGYRLYIFEGPTSAVLHGYTQAVFDPAQVVEIASAAPDSLESLPFQ